MTSTILDYAKIPLKGLEVKYYQKNGIIFENNDHVIFGEAIEISGEVKISFHIAVFFFLVSIIFKNKIHNFYAILDWFFSLSFSWKLVRNFSLEIVLLPQLTIEPITKYKKLIYSISCDFNSFPKNCINPFSWIAC